MIRRGPLLSRWARARGRFTPYAPPSDVTQLTPGVIQMGDMNKIHGNPFGFCAEILNTCNFTGLCNDPRVLHACADLRGEVEKESGKPMLRVKCLFDNECNRNFRCTYLHETDVENTAVMRNDLMRLIKNTEWYANLNKFTELEKKLHNLADVLDLYGSETPASISVVPLALSKADVTNLLKERPAVKPSDQPE